MTVRPIRSGSRYAMRVPTRLLRKAARRGVRGLLIELSMEGARISNLGTTRLAEGDSVTLSLDNGHLLSGTIRWAHDGLAGVKLDAPLHTRDMLALLDFNDACQQQPRYGT